MFVGGDGGQVQASSVDDDGDDGGDVHVNIDNVKNTSTKPPRTKPTIEHLSSKPPPVVPKITPVAAQIHKPALREEDDGEEGDMYDLGGAGGKTTAANNKDDFQAVVDALKHHQGVHADIDTNDDPDLYDLGGQGGQIQVAHDNPTDFGTIMTDEVFEDLDPDHVLNSRLASESASLVLGHDYGIKNQDNHGYLEAGENEDEEDHTSHRSKATESVYHQSSNLAGDHHNLLYQEEPNERDQGGYLHIEVEDEAAFGFQADDL